MKKLIKSLLDYTKRKQRENERDLDFFESDLFYFLKILYVKGDLNKIDIKKKRRLSENSFNRLKKFAETKNYILKILSKDIVYSITPKGTDFLLEFRKVKQAKNNSNWIMMATIVLGVSAIISVMDLFISKPDTKNYIMNSFSKGIAYIFWSVLIIGLIIFVLFILFKVINIIKDKYKKKK